MKPTIEREEQGWIHIFLGDVRIGQAYSSWDGTWKASTYEERNDGYRNVSIGTFASDDKAACAIMETAGVLY